MSGTQPLAYEGEYGFLFQINTGLDATGATGIAFEFKAPDGTKTSKTATAVTTNAAGDFQWTVEEDFFTEGSWTVQCVVSFATKRLKGTLRRFSIGPDMSAT